MQGYFGGWTDLLPSASSRSDLGAPAHVLLIIANMFERTFFILLGILLLFSGGAGRPVRRIPARPQLNIQAARALGVSNRTIMFRHLLQRHGGDHDVPAVHPSSSVMTLTALIFSASACRLDVARRDAQQGKANIQAPWLGMAGFFTVAGMLSLLIFIGEAVRDAFDPRKTFG